MERNSGGPDGPHPDGDARPALSPNQPADQGFCRAFDDSPQQPRGGEKVSHAFD